MKREAAVSASWSAWLDRRPILIAIAGPNGAGKSTFYEAHLRSAGLRFLNADVLAAELGSHAYEAARMVAALRAELIRQNESFIFETVFSDPVGDKVAFLKDASEQGYSVALIFIGLASVKLSRERVAMRTLQGGHDVPDEKLAARFPRTLANLSKAIRELPLVIVFDNSQMGMPFRHVAAFAGGRQIELNKPIPNWLKPLLRAQP